jgi:hypothetical protein
VGQRGHENHRGRLDPGGKNNKRKALYNFKAGRTYTLVVSGRSNSFRLDRIVFREMAVPLSIALRPGNAESVLVTVSISPKVLPNLPRKNVRD